MRLTRYLAVVFCVVATINALSYAAYVALPIPRSDAWHFIDTFVRQAVAGNLQPADFFAQRWAGDHSQPLHRLVLLGHLRAADLDFRIEALVGIVVGIVTCALLALALWSDSKLSDGRTDRGRTLAALGTAAIFAVGLSLNTIDLYAWSLVSLVWISLLVSVLYWMFIARQMRAAVFLPLAALATFAMACILDEVAYAVFAAAVGALVVRDGVRKPANAAAFAACGGLGLLAGRWLIDAMGRIEGAADATSGGLAGVLQLLAGPEAWKVFVAPLADSLVQQVHLDAWLPSVAVPVQVVIAIALAGLHLVFWHRALSGARPRDSVLVLAVALMLFFYASIAGIALSRATQFGAEYFHQSRYAAMYQLNLLALVLMFAAPTARPAAGARRRTVAPLVALLVLQLPISASAWAHGRHVRVYNDNAAKALLALGEDADHASPDCMPIFVICSKPLAVRIRTFALLREHQLSVYSARFRSAHGVDPGVMEPTQPAKAANTVNAVETARTSCRIPVVGYGPTSIGAREVFNRQPDGRNAFWLQVSAGTPAFEVEFEGVRVPVSRAGDVVSIVQDDRQVAAAAAGRSLRFDLVCNGRKVDAIEVVVR